MASLTANKGVMSDKLIRNLCMVIQNQTKKTSNCHARSPNPNPQGPNPVKISSKGTRADTKILCFFLDLFLL